MNQIAIENALPADLLHAIAAVIQAGPFESGKRMAQGLAQEAAKIICSWPLRPTRRCSTVFLQRSTPTRCSRRSPCHAHGVRHAVVGWLPSHIRDALQHEIIVKLSPVPGTSGQDLQCSVLATQTGQCVQGPSCRTVALRSACAAAKGRLVRSRPQHDYREYIRPYRAAAADGDTAF